MLDERQRKPYCPMFYRPLFRFGADTMETDDKTEALFYLLNGAFLLEKRYLMLQNPATLKS